LTLLSTTPASAHGDWDWIARGFPDYHSQYSPPGRPWSCCGEHDIERLEQERVTLDEAGNYVIDGWTFPRDRAYPSEEGHAVIAWHLGAWADESDSGRVEVNVRGKIYNGRHIIGIHCFFFAPGGA
jgi:hypothetical protein